MESALQQGRAPVIPDTRFPKSAVTISYLLLKCHFARELTVINVLTTTMGGLQDCFFINVTKLAVDLFPFSAATRAASIVW